VEVRTQPDLFHHLHIHSWGHRELLEHHRNHTGDIGVGLLDRHARFEPGQSLEAEIPEKHFRALELQRQDHGWIQCQELEVLRQHADNVPCLPIQDEPSSDCGWVSTKPALPVSVTKDHRLGTADVVILA